MKYVILLMLSTLLSINASCQYLTPLQLDNYVPIWSHYSFVPGLNDSQQGYYPIKEFLYKDNDIILVQNIWNNQFLQGIFVERIDYSTGMPKWQFSRYHSEIGTRESSKNAFLKNDKLIIPIYHEDKASVSSIYSKCYLGSKTLSLNSGILIDSFESNHLDPLNRSLLVPYNPFFPIVASYQFPLTDTTISYIVQSATAINTSFKQLTLNHNGHVSDSNFFQIPVPFQSFEVAVKKIDSDRNLIFCSGFKSDLVSGKLETYCNIAVTTPDLLPIFNPLEISAKLHTEPAEYRLEWTGDKYFMIRVREAHSSDPMLNDVFYVLLDYQCNIINKFKISGIEFSKNDAGIRASFISIDQIAVSGLQFINGQHNLNFYTNTNSKDLALVKSISAQSENQSISLFECSFTLNKNFLIHLNQKNNNLPLQIKPNWSLWVLFDASDLGIISNNHELENIQRQIQLIPNPAHDFVTFHLDNETSQLVNQYLIRDIHGKIVKDVSPVVLGRENAISTIGLSTGMYYVQFLVDGKMVDAEKLMIAH
ncbi:MAG: T9SS type A sorting domain-containing protein [Saprospiraceae bacterium]